MNSILAMCSNGAIGYKGHLCHSCRKDMEIFKELTMDNIVIMGNNTFKSMDSTPLKNRINIVLCQSHKDEHPESNLFFINTKDYIVNGFTGVKMDYKERLFNIITHNSSKKVWVIGGKTILNLLSPYIFRAYFTFLSIMPDQYDVSITMEDRIFQNKDCTTLLDTMTLASFSDVIDPNAEISECELKLLRYDDNRFLSQAYLSEKDELFKYEYRRYASERFMEYNNIK